MVVGVIIGFILFAGYWLKNKIFPNSQISKNTQANRQQSESFFYYSDIRTNSKADSSSSRAKAHSKNRSEHRGRIIDVEPDDK